MTEPSEPADPAPGVRAGGGEDGPHERLVRATGLAAQQWLDAAARHQAVDLLQDVLVDPRVSDADRGTAEMLQSTLRLMDLVPIHLLSAALSSDASGQPVLPAGLAENLPGLLERMVTAPAGPAGNHPSAERRGPPPEQVVIDVTRLERQASDTGLPPEISATMKGLAEAAKLLARQRGDTSGGEVGAEHLQPLLEAARSMPDPLAAAMVSRLQVWLRADDALTTGTPIPTALVQEVQAVLELAPAGDPLRPVLQRAQAMMRIQDAETRGDADAVHESAALFRQALEGMGPGHVLAGETRHQVAASGLVIAAMLDDEAARAGAEELVERICCEAPPGDAFEQGRAAVLRSMVQMLRSRGDGGPQARDRLNDALAALEVALQNLPPDHPLLVVAFALLAALLNDRHLSAGLIEDRRAAQFWFRRGAAVAAVVAGADPTAAPQLEAMAAAGALSEAGDRQDATGMSQALEQLHALLETMSPEHLMVPRLRLLAGAGWVNLGLLTEDPATLDRGIDQLVRLDHSRPLDPDTRTAVRVGAAAATLVGAVRRGDPEMLDAALAGLRDVDEPASIDQRIGLWALRGFSHLARHELPGGTGQLAAAVETFTRARDLMADQPHPMLGDVLDGLARAYRAHQPAAAHGRALARQALRAAAEEVLLQSDLADGLVSARGAAERAQDLARWCLGVGEVDEALEALEHGRALVLHAATTVDGVGGQLRAAGRPGLARDWDRELQDAAGRHWPGTPLDAALHELVGDAVSRRVPRDVRWRALQGLRGTPQGARLFEVPSAQEIRAALRRLSVDALVYLIPATDTEPGWLLLRPAEGEAQAVPVPTLWLDHPALGEYLRLGRDPDIVAHALQVWERALGRVCTWAWDMIRALLGVVPAPRYGPVPRIVLAGAGALGSVPWHAARGVLESGQESGQETVACRELQISYTASARQLLDAALRPVLPPGLAPVIVGDPVGNLPGAAMEAAVLAGVQYPGATLLGRLPEAEEEAGRALIASARPATVAAVSAHLPKAGRLGATLVHLGCHARYGASPEQSHLELAPPEPDGSPELDAGDGASGYLTVRSILDQARGRHRSDPGPLVVLSACTSDVTVVLEDEALTLATAFLAAGAASVVGSRWLVSDARTPRMMFAFHHFVIDGRMSPGEALRAAQLWMLDPERPVLEGMPEVLQGDMSAGDPAAASAWAAFAHYGR